MDVTGAAMACVLLAGTTTACGLGEKIFGRTSEGDELSRARAALARVDDLPAGFSDQADFAWQPPFRPSGAHCRKLFDLAGGKAQEQASAIAKTSSFQGTRLGETAGVVVAAYAGGDAQRALGKVARLMERCSVAVVKRAGGGDRLVGSALPVRNIGDGVEARRFKGRAGGYPYEMHLVVVRSGGLLISLVHTGLAKLDRERTETLASTVAARVREATG